MATDFRTYLSTSILSDQNTVSYRSLARAVKCHVNKAKCMLYEYYDEENKRKPGSVYATYLLAGMKKVETPETNSTNGHGDEDDDIAMPSSPPPFTSSMLEPSQKGSEADGAEQAVSVKTIMLVREEDLQEVKSQFEVVTSIHVYSLSPGKIPDLVTLTDIGRTLYADVFAKEDPLVHNKTYGVIQNPHVRRRKGKRPVIPAAPAPKMMPVKEEKGKAAPPAAKRMGASKPMSSLKREETTSRPSSRDSSSTQDRKQPSLKRDASDIFKAFAKSSQQKKAPKQEVKEEDIKMTDADEEGESEDEALFLDTNTRKEGKKRTSDGKKEREDKAVKLRKMMDSDDEAELPPVEKEAGLPADEPAPKKEVAKEGVDGDGDVAWSDSDSEKKPKAKAEPVQEGPRRKRGKRKVLKKRTMKDEDGFLVTKEEEVWEEFSESDHDQPKREVKKAFPVKSSQNNQDKGSQKSAASGKGAKKGGGNIMNFFGKK